MAAPMPLHLASNLLENFRENKVFKMNQKYFTSMYDKQKNIDAAAKEALVTLGESLNSRYKVKHQEDTSNEISSLIENLTKTDDENFRGGQSTNLEFAEKSIRKMERRLLIAFVASNCAEKLQIFGFS